MNLLSTVLLEFSTNLLFWGKMWWRNLRVVLIWWKLAISRMLVLIVNLKRESWLRNIHSRPQLPRRNITARKLATWPLLSIIHELYRRFRLLWSRNQKLPWFPRKSRSMTGNFICICLRPQLNFLMLTSETSSQLSIRGFTHTPNRPVTNTRVAKLQCSLKIRPIFLSILLKNQIKQRST